VDRRTREAAFLVPAGIDTFHFSAASRMAVGSTKPPAQWILYMMQLGCEANHSSTSTAGGPECVKLCLHSPLYLHAIQLK